METQTTITGRIAEILFSNDSGFYVLCVERSDTGITETVAGTGAEIRQGERIIATGTHTHHPRFGRQFKATSLVTEPPEDVEGLRAYLCSGSIKGIGAKLASVLVDALGERARDALGDTEALMSVPGIGPKKAAEIAKCWNEAAASREALIFLQRHGLGVNRARAVYEIHGAHTIAIVQKNAYRALNPVRGVGFRIADEIALSMGLGRDHRDRVVAGLRHVCDERAEQGHTAAEARELVQEASRLLALPPRLIEPRLKLLAAHNRLVTLKDGRVGLPDLLNAERRVAERMAAMAANAAALPAMAAHPRTRDGNPLTEEQVEAVRLILTHQFAVLTGGPGAGKTTVTCVVADALASERLRLALCAPTGRAARRMSEATGRQALTIHKLLEAGPFGFARDEENPLELDAVIVDEASMVDVRLMHSLIRALPPHARLILVGDPDQLPAVGPGNVLRDVIASETVPVARLRFIHRQSSDSPIIVQSHRVNAGQIPEHGGAFEIRSVAGGPVALAAEVLTVVDELAEEGFDPIHDVQVLTPMHKGDVGTQRLNAMLRRSLGLAEQTEEEAALRKNWVPGEKVVQTVNNYEHEVMNGDLGFIEYRESATGAMSVEFDGRFVKLQAGETKSLQLAYAMTGHKAQGSEFPAVVIPLTTQHWHMLERQWLYTAMTRGKQRVVLVAEPRALNRAVTHLSGRKRQTTLKDCLLHEAAQQPTNEAIPC